MSVAIPSGWYSIPLRELIYDFERGISYSSEEISQPSDVKMVNLACIDKSGYYRDGELKDYSGKVSDEMKVYPGDLLIACTDLTRNADIIGTPIIVPEGQQFYVFSMDLAKFIPNDKVDKEFLYYALKSPSYRKYIKPWASGTNVLHLNLKGVYDYVITLPKDINEQKQIANTLKNIDDALLLNKKINDNLAS